MTPSAQVSPARVPDPQVFRFVARQPILNREQEVFGYELLFRDGVENFFRSSDPEAAARSTLDSSLLMGLDVLRNGQRAFLNCTRDLLIKDCILLLTPSQTVVGDLESVAPDAVVIEACKRLNLAGYMIALDDFVASDPREPLVPFADILKVDFGRATWPERESILKRGGSALLRSPPPPHPEVWGRCDTSVQNHAHFGLALLAHRSVALEGTQRPTLPCWPPAPTGSRRLSGQVHSRSSPWILSRRKTLLERRLNRSCVFKSKHVPPFKMNVVGD